MKKITKKLYSKLSFEKKALIGKKMYTTVNSGLRRWMNAKVKNSEGKGQVPGLPYLEVGDPEKPTILLVHGFGDTKEGYLNSALLLYKKYHVVIPDLPGFADHLKDPAVTYDLEYYAHAILNFIEELGLKNVNIMGNSLGGAISVQTVLLAQDKFNSLTLIDSAGFHFSEIPSLLDEYAEGNNVFQVRTMDDYKILLSRVFHKVPFIPDPIYQFLYGEICRNHDWYGKLMDELIGGPDIDTTDQKLIEELTFNNKVSAITIPTLIAWGEKDDFFPVDIAYMIEKKIESSKLHVFKNTGHAPQIENFREFVRVIKKFLNEVALA